MKHAHSISEMMEICLLAGKLLLESGAETYRVEDTIARLASSGGIESIEVFVAPTVIILSMRKPGQAEDYTKLVRITKRSTDLHRVTLVNDLSRKVSREFCTLEEAKEKLKQMERDSSPYPPGMRITAAALVSGCFTLMFQGSWKDFLPAFIDGGLGYFLFLFSKRFVSVRFFSELLASCLIGVVAKLAVLFGLGKEVDRIIIGSVMPFVPGVLITDAVSDLMKGHLSSGMLRGAEAFLTAFAIGTGIAVVIAVW
ncbi:MULTISPECIES: threonine/serine exporter family protein [unclassified Thermoactinomyces]|jgi:uncharacterized membrane protein YjjP (DUF1212 family)|uniref:threonine/serine exporter family protein n=1 Tax=unclassified Thermoactinomyces TaxID=2634588 RepID=UPI0018DB2F5C|nr:MULTISPECIES: threonine/serine exporter family protein [unclassified Thermoactinomyces]MBH8599393.1 threonine/serine exporter family protein [Thermoactinomyces sp. CICC 10523]MBH8608285.1 threonine/serine exporter family protein [Thermoactinomyces sp. CICC 10521]